MIGIFQPEIRVYPFHFLDFDSTLRSTTYFSITVTLLNVPLLYHFDNLTGPYEIITFIFLNHNNNVISTYIILILLMLL